MAEHRDAAHPERPHAFGGLFDFGFTSYATPSVIRLLYVVGIVLIVLSYVGLTVGFFARGVGLGIAALVSGGVVALFAVLLLRVVLEFLLAVVRLAQATSPPR